MRRDSIIVRLLRHLGIVKNNRRDPLGLCRMRQHAVVGHGIMGMVVANQAELKPNRNRDAKKDRVREERSLGKKAWGRAS